jgi:hypothetical protein
LVKVVEVGGGLAGLLEALPPGGRIGPLGRGDHTAHSLGGLPCPDLARVAALVGLATSRAGVAILYPHRRLAGEAVAKGVIVEIP